MSDLMRVPRGKPRACRALHASGVSWRRRIRERNAAEEACEARKAQHGSSAGARLPAARGELHPRHCLRAQILACGGEDSLQQWLRQR